MPSTISASQLAKLSGWAWPKALRRARGDGAGASSSWRTSVRFDCSLSFVVARLRKARRARRRLCMSALRSFSLLSSERMDLSTQDPPSSLSALRPASNRTSRSSLRKRDFSLPSPFFRASPIICRIDLSSHWPTAS